MKENIFQTPIDVRKKTVYFIGDSLTHRCDLNKFYPDFDTVNFGISGDTLEEFFMRGKFKFEREPDAAVFLIGINDLNYNYTSVMDLSLCYRLLFAAWQKYHPDMKVVLQSLYPVIWQGETKYPMAGNICQQIKNVNTRLRELGRIFGFRFVDIYPQLAKDDQLDEKFAADCIHINDLGYEVVAKNINEALNDLFSGC